MMGRTANRKGRKKRVGFGKTSIAGPTEAFGSTVRRYAWAALIGLAACIVYVVVISRGVKLTPSRLLGTALLVVLATLLEGMHVGSCRHRVLERRLRLVVVSAFVLAILVLGQVAMAFTPGPHLVPLALMGIVLTVAYGPRLALGVTVYAAFLLMLVMARDDLSSGFLVVLPLLVGSVGAVLITRDIRNRTTLLKVGGVSAACQTAAVVGLWLFAEPGAGELPLQCAYALTNGLIVGFVATGVLPFVERGFGVPTSVSLLELADLNRPLLKNLALVAPGTYNHSLIVGTLAEAAAPTVGASVLLSRACAYYHDIGKLNKPDYFVENWTDAASKHEKLSATMSTLIIIAHVKDGLELARDFDLPRPIRDVIAEHHGTTVVRYFYAQAKEQEAPGEKVSEQTFRYPGPKPRSKEAAIIMVADAVESASRTLSEPNPSRIGALVDRITQERLLEDQFDECDLTLSDVHKIAQSFTKTLTGIFHARVKYPAPSE